MKYSEISSVRIWLRVFEIQKFLKGGRYYFVEYRYVTYHSLIPVRYVSGEIEKSMSLYRKITPLE